MGYKEKIIQDLKLKKCKIFKPMYNAEFDFVILHDNKTYNVSLIELDNFIDIEIKECDFVIVYVKSTNEIIYTYDLFNYINSEKTLKHFDENVYVTGPYTNGDGRRYVRYVYRNSKKQKLTLYSRYLMEQKLGRYLDGDETVDHIDRNKNNDSIENLQILSSKEHFALDVKRVKDIELKCVWCSKKVIRAASDLSSKHKQGMSGPFCSNSCSGKYGSDIQNERTNRLPPQPNVPIEEREYYYLDKK